MAKPNSKAPLGEGGRFAALKKKLAAKGASDPAALAAYIGRKKLGKAKFQRLSAAARRSTKGSPAATDKQAQMGFRVLERGCTGTSNCNTCSK